MVLERAGGNRRIVALAFVLAAAPILLVHLPPVLDFPNHLARIWLAAGGAELPPLSSIYEIDWANTSTNMAVDLVASWLATVLPLAVVSKILLILMFLGPPLGGCLLHRAVFGAFHPWQLSFLALAWTTTAIAGFMSYQIGLAASLLCAAHVQTRLAAARTHELADARPVLGGSAADPPIRSDFLPCPGIRLAIGPRVSFPPAAADLLRTGRQLVMPVAAAAVPMLLLLLLAPHPPGAEVTDTLAPVWRRPRLVTAALTVLSPILTYDIVMDLLMAAPMGIAFLWALRAGALKVHAGLLIVGGALLVLAPSRRHRSATPLGWSVDCR